jgi:translocator protein
VFWLLVCFAAAGIGSAMTSKSLADWYPGLAKPTWNPPDWVFGPVWTLLYTMMAIAAWLVWRNAGWHGAPVPLALFTTQLALNVIWSGLFFALESPGAAFAEIVLLWLSILATLVQFWRIDRAAGALLGPYLAWVSFAAALNFTIWQLNR